MMAQMPFGVIFPVIAGIVFDRTGSYQGIFMIYGAVVMLSALSIALIRRPYWAEIVASERPHIEPASAARSEPVEAPPGR